MNTPEITRKFKMSDATLIQLTDSVQDSANRDLTELGAYGVDAATLTALETARNTFEEEPTDQVLSGLMVYATQLKNAKKEELRIAIRQIADRARIKFGEQDGRFRTFGVDMLSKQTDYEVFRTGRRVAARATDYLTELEPEGVTAPLIAALETLASEFDVLIDEKDRAVRNRDAAVDKRIKLGNELYELLVTLSAKGKLCWQDTNEALYNDYILNPSSGNTTADVITGNVAGTSVVNLSVTGNNNDSVFKLKNTGSEPLEFYFATEPTDPSGPMIVVVTPSSETSIIATELGYNAVTHTRLNVHNPSAAAGSYEVMWE